MDDLNVGPDDMTHKLDKDKDYDAITQSLSLSRAADILGVSTKTLRNWDEKGKINVVRTPGGHRRIPIKEISRLLAGEKVGIESESEEMESISPSVDDTAGDTQPETGGDITPSEYLEFIKSFGLEGVDFLKPEKTDMSLLPKEGLFDNLNRDQINYLIRQIVHKMEDTLSCRLTDSEYQKLANIVATVHDRGSTLKDVKEEKVRPGIPSNQRGYTLGYLRYISKEVT